MEGNTGGLTIMAIVLVGLIIRNKRPRRVQVVYTAGQAMFWMLAIAIIVGAYGILSAEKISTMCLATDDWVRSGFKAFIPAAVVALLAVTAVIPKPFWAQARQLRRASPTVAKMEKTAQTVFALVVLYHWALLTAPC